MAFGLTGCSDTSAPSATAASSPSPLRPEPPPEGTDSAAETIGERIFLETRFAQAFKQFVAKGGNLNDPGANDPVLDTTATTTPGSPIAPGPFKGLTMNCRACHLVDELVDAPVGGMRTYANFARRSPIPERPDGRRQAERNSRALVNAALDRPDGLLLHFDGEFGSLEDLVIGTMTGRNFGWMPGEGGQALTHLAAVVRGDDGTTDLAREFGGLSYRIVLNGTDPSIPDEFRIPAPFRVPIATASDHEIADGVARLLAAYVRGLQFSKADEAGTPIRSPYDIFLERNGLPGEPDDRETPLDYSRRLRQLIEVRRQAGTLQFVASNPHRSDGSFQFHEQPFAFGPTELADLSIFLAEPAAAQPSSDKQSAGMIGHCLACHAAPQFTDFKAHNTGTTQKEYDAVHGAGSCMALPIPSLSTRNGAPNAYLPATDQHPIAQEPFRQVAAVDHPLWTDLGVWNIFANPDMPTPQATIRALLCESKHPCSVSDAALLDRAIARFKTPGLRDLGHSAPYMHNGQFD